MYPNFPLLHRYRNCSAIVCKALSSFKVQIKFRIRTKIDMPAQMTSPLRRRLERIYPGQNNNSINTYRILSHSNENETNEYDEIYEPETQHDRAAPRQPLQERSQNLGVMHQNSTAAVKLYYRPLKQASVATRMSERRFTGSNALHIQIPGGKTGQSNLGCICSSCTSRYFGICTTELYCIPQ